MKTQQEWLSAYGQTHQNSTNKKIHMVCVPAILFSIIGILWALPKPDFFQTNQVSNWATLAIIPALIFYFRLSGKAFLIMLATMTIMCAGQWWLSNHGYPLYALNITIFILAWIGQFYGHHVEGKKPSFFDDLKFLLIGPLWVYYH